MSMIFLNGQREASPKLVRFLILLSKIQCEEALKMLSDFNRESYYNHLNKLLQIVVDETALRADIVKMRQMNMQLKYKITNLNGQLIQERLRQRPNNMSDHQKQIIEVFHYLQANDLNIGQKKADLFNFQRLSTIFQELNEYRWLKEHIRHNYYKQNRLKFQSTEGEQLKILVVDNTSRYVETIAFLKQQFKKISRDLEPSEVPVNIFGEQFKKQYQTFLENLRKMKNSFQDINRPIKEKIVVFAERQRIKIDWQADSIKCIDDLFQKLDKILERPQQQRGSFRRSMSIISAQSVDLNTSIMSNNNRLSSDSKRKTIFGNQHQLKINEIHKIISKYIQPIPKFDKLSLSQKIDQIIKKIEQFTDEFQRVKINDEKFINSFIMGDTNNFREYSNHDKALLSQDIQPELKDKHSDDQNIGQNKQIQRVVKQLKEERQKRTKVQQQNTRLILRVKQYSSKENSSFIDQINKNTRKQCEASIENLQKQVLNLQQTINDLKKQLEQKISSIKSLQIARQETRLRFERQKQNLLDASKVKYNKLGDEYDTLMDEFNNLQRLHEEHLQISQQTTKRSQSSQNEVKILRDENAKLKQQLKKQKKSKGIGITRRLYNEQAYQSSESSSSFTKTINLESNILKQSKELQEKISSLESQNKWLSNQIKNIEYYKTLLEKENRECSQLKQQMSILSKQKQDLSKHLSMIEIRKVTHNEKNLPYLHLFPPGFIFEDHDYQERLFLLEHLQRYTGPIKKTRLLYRADAHNRTNFHKYVDKQRHIVAIFKTIYGRLIAGYSEEAFDVGGIIRGHGMIFSLWGRKVFELKQKRAISYDDYFLIFGNSELRIKSGEFHLFSNFGIASSYYNNRGEKVHALLGEDKERDVDLSHFQVYALDLQH